MNPQDIERETLRQLIGSREKKAFSKAIGLSGGPSMLSQHLSGNRPISLEAGVCYARGLGVRLDQISARLAELGRTVIAALDPNTAPVAHQTSPPTLEQALPVLLGRLAGLNDYTAGIVLAALAAATRSQAPLEDIERDLLKWLGDRTASAAPAAPPEKRQARG